MKRFFEVLDRVVWDDRYEELRAIASMIIVVAAASYFGHAWLVAEPTPVTP